MSRPAVELPPWMTPEQSATYRELLARWPRVSIPVQDGDEAHVECFYPGALGSRWVVIPPDGRVQTPSRLGDGPGSADPTGIPPHAVAENCPPWPSHLERVSEPARSASQGEVLYQVAVCRVLAIREAKPCATMSSGRSDIADVSALNHLTPL